MRTPELLYAIPTFILVPALLIILGLVMFLGLREGRSRTLDISDSSKAQISALQSSLLGLLALLLGFSFSLALGRFEDRSVAQVAEANAIGTAWLRADLLEGAARDDLRGALADYAQSRLAAGAIPLTDPVARLAEGKTSEAAFTRAWAFATAAARQAPNPATVALVTALNEVADSFSRRDAALNRHVPELVLLLLTATFLFLGWVLGYSSGLSGERPPTPLVVMVVLIVLLLTMILDLDRPRRGIIQVDQSSMIAVVHFVLTEAGRPVPASN